MRLFTSLTLCAVLASSACSTPPQISTKQATQSIERVVKDAKQYFKEGKTEHVQALLEERQRIKGTLDPSAHYLLALSYIANKKLDKAEASFRSLVYRFEENPLIIEDIQKTTFNLHSTRHYKKSERLVEGYVGWDARLYAVAFFLRLARKDYEGAARYAKPAIEKFPDKKSEYQIMFERLIQNSKGDKKAGYTMIKKVFD